MNAAVHWQRKMLEILRKLSNFSFKFLSLVELFPFFVYYSKDKTLTLGAYNPGNKEQV